MYRIRVRAAIEGAGNIPAGQEPQPFAPLLWLTALERQAESAVPGLILKTDVKHK